MNAINVIAPYKYAGMWVFDDARVGLVQEPFVEGADVIIDRAVEGIPNAEDGFLLLFSATPFPGNQFRLSWRRADAGGNFYYSQAHNMEGWLCPALLKLAGIKERIAAGTFSFAGEFPNFRDLGSLPDGGSRRTCGQVFDDFLTHCESRMHKDDMAPITLSSYRRVLNTFRRPQIGEAPFPGGPIFNTRPNRRRGKLEQEDVQQCDQCAAASLQVRI